MFFLSFEKFFLCELILFFYEYNLRMNKISFFLSFFFDGVGRGAMLSSEDGSGGVE